MKLIDSLQANTLYTVEGVKEYPTHFVILLDDCKVRIFKGDPIIVNGQPSMEIYATINDTGDICGSDYDSNKFHFLYFNSKLRTINFVDPTVIHGKALCFCNPNEYCVGCSCKFYKFTLAPLCPCIFNHQLRVHCWKSFERKIRLLWHLYYIRNIV